MERRAYALALYTGQRLTDLVEMARVGGAFHIGKTVDAIEDRRQGTEDDDRDAEAATRPTMRFVEVKTEAQLDMHTLHRSRERPL